MSVLQFLEGLSDRQAADTVRSRLDWKYALSLELTDPGLDHTVLSEFRTRLLQGGAEQRLLDVVLDEARARGWLKERVQQRTDSTHVLAASRMLRRLEVVGETLRHTLNVLAEMAPERLRSLPVPAEWTERYGRRVEEYRLPKGSTEREQYANQVGADGWHLLEALAQLETPAWLCELPAVVTLRAVWVQQYHPKDPRVQRARQEISELAPGARRRSSHPQARSTTPPTTRRRAMARSASTTGSATKHM